MVSAVDVLDIVARLNTNDPTIDDLDLKASNIGAKELGSLADALRKNTKLKKLTLHTNQAGDSNARDALASLTSALKNNTTLTHLNIANNRLTDESARALASLLKENDTLIELNLNYNRIGDEGAGEFASALKENDTLKNLNLWGNDIGDEGARALIHAVRDYNTTLTSLNLDKNEKIYSKETRDDLNKGLLRNDKQEKDKKLAGGLDADFEGLDADGVGGLDADFEGDTCKGLDADFEGKMEGHSDNSSVESRFNQNRKFLTLKAHELFRQQAYFSLSKHKLASINLSSKNFIIFTFPLSLLAMASGILAFLASSETFSNKAQVSLNIIVGSLSFLIAFLQTLSTHFKFDVRGEMHESTAIDLRDLREDLDTDSNKSKVLLRDKGNNEIDGKLEKIMDDNQKQYKQCLKGCKSTVPLPINDAFHQLDARLNATLSTSGRNELRRMYKTNANDVIYYQACEILAAKFSCFWGWPFLLPNPNGAVDETMKTLRKNIRDADKFWVKFPIADATEDV